MSENTRPAVTEERRPLRYGADLAEGADCHACSVSPAGAGVTRQIGLPSLSQGKH